MNSSLINLHGRHVVIRVAHEGEYGNEMYRGKILDVGPEFIALEESSGEVLIGRRFITSLREAQ